jgi:hypothetical protein
MTATRNGALNEHPEKSAQDGSKRLISRRKIRMGGILFSL